MITTTKNMTMPITFEVHCTVQWLGRRDKAGLEIYEHTYQADATLLGNVLTRSDRNEIYKTAEAATGAARRKLRALCYQINGVEA